MSLDRLLNQRTFFTGCTTAAPTPSLLPTHWLTIRVMNIAQPLQINVAGQSSVFSGFLAKMKWWRHRFFVNRFSGDTKFFQDELYINNCSKDALKTFNLFDGTYFMVIEIRKI
jgi:hypothetical protein